MADFSSGRSGVAAVCYRLAQPVAQELGLTLWDVRFVKEGTSWYLRIIIDKEGGVSIDDCVEMSHRMDPVLDEADPIPHAYCLEVMSPGVGRELTRPEHFEAFLGRPVITRLIRPLDGAREFTGTLAAFADGVVTLDGGDGQSRSFHKKELASVHVAEDA